MPDLSGAVGVLGKIFTDFGAPDNSLLSFSDIVMYVTGIGILVFKDLRDEFVPGRFGFLNRGLLRWSIYILLFVMVLGIGVLDGGQFIYAGF